jgi:DNA/RNA-binding domain of Phe-tRNA-synthetase-like protein
MANRFSGPRAVNMRQEPVPWAYRVFFRQVGVDPDERRTPIEAIAVERLRAGGFPSRNLLDDAMLIATLETGVPLVAFDAGKVGAEVGLRLSHPGEKLGGREDGRPLAQGQIVIADEDRSLSVLFGDMAEECGVHPSTERMVLGAVRVRGVPRVSVEECLWIAHELLSGG